MVSASVACACTLVLLWSFALGNYYDQDKQVNSSGKIEGFLNVSILKDLDESIWLPILRRRHTIDAVTLPASRVKRQSEDYSYSEGGGGGVDEEGDSNDEDGDYSYSDTVDAGGGDSNQKEDKDQTEATTTTTTKLTAAPGNVLMLPVKTRLPIFKNLILTTARYPRIATTEEPVTVDKETELTTPSTESPTLAVTSSPVFTPASTTITPETPTTLELLDDDNLPPTTEPYRESTEVSKTAESETAESKTVESKTAVSKAAESKAAESKTAESNISSPINLPPMLTSHLQPLVLNAGKFFQYSLPEDLFTDPEDGNNLTFKFYHKNNNSKLLRDSWLQFNSDELELYGIPLESHVGIWFFIIEARDSAGESAIVTFEINVQQVKEAISINHMFSLELKLNHLFNNTLDWQIRVLEGIINLYGDATMENLTVLDAAQNADVCKFWWYNDTVPEDSMFCPMNQIMQLWQVLTVDSGAPSPDLLVAMRPDFTVVDVRWEGLGACEAPTSGSTVTQLPHSYSPELRNSIDTVTAIIGHLLVYKIPEDTFFDPEDGGTRNLDLSLRLSNGNDIPPDHWLQFDTYSQDLYGLPNTTDLGVAKYRLIVQDSSKNKLYSTVTVQVIKSYPFEPTAEFRATLDYPFKDVMYNTENKRKVLETIAALFGQRDTRDMKIVNITDSPTTVVWYNTSLHKTECPKREIQELQQSINIFGIEHIPNKFYIKNLTIMSITIKPIGLCELTKVHAELGPHLAHGSPFFKCNDKSVAAKSLMSFLKPAMSIIFCVALILLVIVSLAYKERTVQRNEEQPRIRIFG